MWFPIIDQPLVNGFFVGCSLRVSLALHVSASDRGLTYFAKWLDIIIVVFIECVPLLLPHVLRDIFPPFDIGCVFGDVEVTAARPDLFAARDALIVSVLL